MENEGNERKDRGRKEAENEDQEEGRREGKIMRRRKNNGRKMKRRWKRTGNRKHCEGGGSGTKEEM